MQVQNVHAFAHRTAPATYVFQHNLIDLDDVDSSKLTSAEPVPPSRSPSSSSSDSSELVITPETIPRDPAVAVPDFPEDESLGLGLGVQLAVNALPPLNSGKRPHYVPLRDVQAGMPGEDIAKIQAPQSQSQGWVKLKRAVQRFQNVIASSRSTYAI